MSLLVELLKWASTELKPWQSDAVRRLFKFHTLSPEDFDELTKLLKQSKGFDIPDLAAKGLTKDDLPNAPEAGESAAIVQLGPCRNVNKLKPDDFIPIEPTGMTVIYGDNGSGKSGYARVVKSACKSRVKSDPVLPDARRSKAEQGTPEAEITIRRKSDVPVMWQEGAPPPKELGEVAILDTECARAYTDDEGDLIFLPWGLDVVENLARVVFPAVQKRINAEIGQIDTSTAAFTDLHGPTKVGTLLHNFSSQTKPTEVEGLATLSGGETAELEQLEKTLAEKDPKEKIKALQNEADRIREIVDTVRLRTASVDEPFIADIRKRDTEAEAAVAAERLAAVNLRANEKLLPGTGEVMWKQMFEAAARFATTSGHAHSIPEEGEPCPLCQQTVSADGADRFKRFVKYIQADAARIATAREEDRRLGRELTDAQNVLLNLPGSARTYLEGAGLTKEVDEYEKSLIARRDAALAAFETHKWDSIPPYAPLDPRRKLNELANKRTAEAKDIEKLLPPGAREQMQRRRDELDARKRLGVRKVALLELLARLQAKAKLEACLEDLKTKPITDKARALANETVNQALGDALNDEFEALGIKQVKARLITRYELARPVVKLVLDLPTDVDPEDVLSEGELRAVAIASFLAELTTSGHRGPIVFDDPVSSLDHGRRERVAKRLAHESKTRQVVVFTHDSIFLGALRKELERIDAKPAVRHLLHSPRYAGLVRDGLPWDHLPAGDRIDKLEKLIRKFKEDWDEVDNETAGRRMREAYSRMREVIEKIVEDTALEGVVMRREDHIRVPNLRRVVGIESAPVEELIELYDRYGDTLSGHDKPSARQFEPPNPDEAMADVAKIRSVLEKFKARPKGAAGAQRATARAERD